MLKIEPKMSFGQPTVEDIITKIRALLEADQPKITKAFDAFLGRDFPIAINVKVDFSEKHGNHVLVKHSFYPQPKYQRQIESDVIDRSQLGLFEDRKTEVHLHVHGDEDLVDAEFDRPVVDPEDRLQCPRCFHIHGENEGSSEKFPNGVVVATCAECEKEYQFQGEMNEGEPDEGAAA